MEIAPSTISQQWMCILTHYDKMSDKERKIVFSAYEYNLKLGIYKLKNLKLLTQPIIKKLSL